MLKAGRPVALFYSLIGNAIILKHNQIRDYFFKQQ